MRSSVSHGDSERPSHQRSASRSCGAPRRRRRPAVWSSSRVQRWRWSALSTRTTRSSRPRSRAHAISSSGTVATRMPRISTLRTGAGCRVMRSSLRACPAELPTATDNGRSSGTGGSHRPCARAAVSPVKQYDAGSTSAHALRLAHQRGSPSSPAGMATPRARRSQRGPRQRGWADTRPPCPDGAGRVTRALDACGEATGGGRRDDTDQGAWQKWVVGTPIRPFLWLNHPLRRSRAGSPARRPYGDSSSTVNGPSLTDETSMWAPKTPRSTCVPAASSAAHTASYNGSLTSPGAAAAQVGRRPLRASP